MCINFKFCVFLFIASAYGQKCSFKRLNGTEVSADEIKYGIVLDPIQDTASPGLILLNFSTTDVNSISGQPISSSKDHFFMIPVLQNYLFQVVLADIFVDYEKYETKDSNSIYVTFNCNGGTQTTLEIILRIIDTNNHDPQFVNAPYSYKVSMPLPKNFPLHLLYGISARDVDLTNNNITFFVNESDINSQGFSASWLATDSVDTKLHRASLITTTAINFKNDFSFKIYARDTGSIRRTVSAPVTIIVDKDNSILRFAKPIYIADYSNLTPEVANGTIFTFEQGEILLSVGADDSVKYYLQEKSNEYQENFNLITHSNGSIQLQLINPPSRFFNESFVLLILNATKPGVDDTTVLHISLPGRSTYKNSSISTTESPIIESNNDDSADSTVLIVLGVLLAVVTIALIVMIIIYKRRSRPVVTEKVNGIQEKNKDMEEVERNSSNPVSSARRSVAFNDIVEEIKIARL
ncbi:uncharacterized protein LOC141530964 [Cotesia typhae]|uniref:uncharacterized protein LOC141530964 n=1 Tax=Cotesia typhae TaxID=2053667 RepID=UPI003D6940B9